MNCLFTCINSVCYSVTLKHVDLMNRFVSLSSLSMADSSVSAPRFGIRASDGASMCSFDPTTAKASRLFYSPNESSAESCRVLSFSPDGTLLALCDGKSTRVYETATSQELYTLPLRRTTGLRFSPRSTLLCIFEPFAIRKNETPNPLNLQIVEARTGTLVKGFQQKSQADWAPQWTDDEGLVSRMQGSEIFFHESNDFANKCAAKLVLPNVGRYRASPVSAPQHFCAAYIKGVKGAPSSVRIFAYPCFESGASSAISSKSFFKADRAELKWNARGTALLCLTSSDIDSSSYYGEQTLYLIRTNGDSLRLDLPKPGPIYGFEWNPQSHEFCVVFGFMPAKAAFFNLQGDITYDFGTGPRNEVHYDPSGRIVCLAGFGNLRGVMEMWSSEVPRRKLAKFSAEDTTYFEWCPDGEHIVTATTAPRLKVSNGFRIWQYTGEQILHVPTPDKQEMWQFKWMPGSRTPTKPLRQGKIVEGAASSSAHPLENSGAVVGGAYVPPHMRGCKDAARRVKADFRDEELSDADKAKAAREAAGPGKGRKKKKPAADGGDEQHWRDRAAAEMATKAQNALPAGCTPTGDPEKDKKIKKLANILQQIATLKEQQKEGKELELNQVKKIEREDEVIAELETLQVG